MLMLTCMASIMDSAADHVHIQDAIKTCLAELQASQSGGGAVCAAATHTADNDATTKGDDPAGNSYLASDYFVDEDEGSEGPHHRPPDNQRCPGWPAIRLSRS